MSRDAATASQPTGEVSLKRYPMQAGTLEQLRCATGTLVFQEVVQALNTLKHSQMSKTNTT